MKTKEFKQVTVSGKIYQWKFDENILSIWKEGKKLFEKNIIIKEPLAFMRGKTFDDSLIILDEAQNCTWKQIVLFITRMGKNSKIIITGDITQYDIRKDMMALLQFKDMIKDIKDVGCFEFTKEDIMRDPILIEITDRYEKLKYSREIKEEL
jgi:phosphate starvation-inducible PhoH-like protein